MRRKKWSEEEERTLISKYGEMAMEGSLMKLKTREKKFEPIAAHVNALHNYQDAVSFPWEWSWRDLSVKIQNMRHQYLGVKQKIRRPAYAKDVDVGSGGLPRQQQQQQPQTLPPLEDEFDWEEGVVHWPNFLRYKAVFGDLELESSEFGAATGGSVGGGGVRGAGIGGVASGGHLGYGAHPLQQMGGGGGGVGRERRMSPMSMMVRQALAYNARLPGEGGGSSTDNVEREELNAGLGDGGASELGLEEDEEDMREEVDAMMGPKQKRLKVQQQQDMTTDTVCEGEGSGGGGGGGGGVSAVTDVKVLEFLGAYIAEQRERDAQREAREREKERVREERELVREAAEREREQNRQERERMREEAERRREREREEREWERDLVNRQRWDEEKQRERVWEEKREREKQEWRERMTALQLGHQASIAQLQAQMMQSQQNVVSLLLGVFLHTSPVEETPGQRSSLALQILHNFQQQHLGDGTFQLGERKGGIEDAAYVMD